jgi:aryl-alcohol dehydrogenase-like predicted oxidoreductase
VKIALGTVQFGLQYGVSNTGQRPSLDEARSVVALGRARGLSMLDTATAYGDSEQRLGEIGVADWKIVTKLPALPGGTADVRGWLSGMVRQSLSRLRVSSIYGLLLHRPLDLLGPHGDQLFGALRQCQADKTVEKVGVSIYGPEQLDAIGDRFAFDLVQGPYNVLDRRIAASGWLDRLQARGIEFHARSAFLQGLLLMPAESRPPKFQRWNLLLSQYDEWVAASAVSRVRAALGAALALPGVSQIVVGAQSASQLAEIIDAAESPAVVPPAGLISDDAELIDPSRW